MLVRDWHCKFKVLIQVRIHFNVKLLNIMRIIGEAVSQPGVGKFKKPVLLVWTTWQELIQDDPNHKIWSWSLDFESSWVCLLNVIIGLEWTLTEAWQLSISMSLARIHSTFWFLVCCLSEVDWLGHRTGQGQAECISLWMVVVLYCSHCTIPPTLPHSLHWPNTFAALSE